MQSTLKIIPLEEGDRLYRLKCEHAISSVLFTPGPNGLTDDDVLRMVKEHHKEAHGCDCANAVRMADLGVGTVPTLN